MVTQTKQNTPVSPGKESCGATLSTLHPVADMERKLERMFDRFFGRRRPSLARWPDFSLAGELLEEMEPRVPSLDLVDLDNEVLVRAEAPGIDKKDIDIPMTDILLIIKRQSSRETKEEKDNYHRHEISRSSFARSVTLPRAVDGSKAIQGKIRSDQGRPDPSESWVARAGQ